MDLVSQKLQPVMTTGWQNYSLSEPSVPMVVSADTTPPLHYSQKIEKSEQHDSFDKKRLLKYVPSTSRVQASRLLQEIEERNNEINFDSNGIIFIDQISIENSDMYHVFPFLFKKRHPKNVAGFQELIKKIEEMGLQDLIKNKVSVSKVQDKKAKLVINREKSEKVNWWYLGP